jgi:hypothetical protein
MAAHTHQGDAPQGAVGLPVPAAVQAVAVGAAGEDGNGYAAAQPGELRLGCQPVGVVAGGDQQLSGGVDTNSGHAAGEN